MDDGQIQSIGSYLISRSKNMWCNGQHIWLKSTSYQVQFTTGILFHTNSTWCNSQIEICTKKYFIQFMLNFPLLANFTNRIIDQDNFNNFQMIGKSFHFCKIKLLNNILQVSKNFIKKFCKFDNCFHKAFKEFMTFVYDLAIYMLKHAPLSLYTHKHKLNITINYN